MSTAIIKKLALYTILLFFFPSLSFFLSFFSMPSLFDLALRKPRLLKFYSPFNYSEFYSSLFFLYFYLSLNSIYFDSSANGVIFELRDSPVSSRVPSGRISFE